MHFKNEAEAILLDLVYIYIYIKTGKHMGFQIANPASRYIHIYIMAPIYLYIYQ